MRKQSSVSRRALLLSHFRLPALAKFREQGIIGLVGINRRCIFCNTKIQCS